MNKDTIELYQTITLSEWHKGSCLLAQVVMKLLDKLPDNERRELIEAVSPKKPEQGQ